MPATLDKSLMTRHFSLHVADYEAVTPVQKEMGIQLLNRAQTALQGHAPQRILELGCGTGRLTQELHRRFPNAQLTAVDMSGTMLDFARAQSAKLPVRWLEADAEQIAQWLPSDQRYDLIVSNAMIQWLSSPLQSLKGYRSYLAASGILAVSTFGADTFQELRAAFSAAERELGRPPQPRTLSMLHGSDLATLAGADVRETHVRQWFGSVREFLRSIKLTGASLANADGPRPVDRALYNRFRELYEERFQDPISGDIPATYHCLSCICPADS